MGRLQFRFIIPVGESHIAQPQLLLFSPFQSPHRKTDTIDIKILFISVKSHPFGTLLLHFGGIGESAYNRPLRIQRISIHDSCRRSILRTIFFQILIVHNKDIGIPRTVIFYLIIKMVDDHQIIVPAIPFLPGLLQCFTYAAYFQIRL